MKKTLFFLLALLGATLSIQAQQASSLTDQHSSSSTRLVGKLVNENDEPITGYANAVASPALEFRSEGWVAGTAARMCATSSRVKTRAFSWSSSCSERIFPWSSRSQAADSRMPARHPKNRIRFIAFSPGNRVRFLPCKVPENYPCSQKGKRIKLKIGHSLRCRAETGCEILTKIRDYHEKRLSLHKLNGPHA